MHLRKFKKYPWNSKKEAKAYFDNLIEDGSHLSMVKYYDLMMDQFEEAIHIKLSWNLIFKMASISFILLAVFVGIKGLFIPGLAILALGAVSEGLSNLMEKQAYEEEAAKPTMETIKFIFNQ